MPTQRIEAALEHLLDPLELPDAAAPADWDPTDPQTTSADTHPAPEQQAGDVIVEDTAQVTPDVFEVLFENDRVRLLEVIMQPGQKTAVHSHPARLVYALSAGKYVSTASSGETADFELSPGGVFWMDATEHATSNAGSSAIRALVIEPK
jgi:quercetin dioxygenase-like cupin family protein